MRHVAVNTLAYLADTISRAAGTPMWPSSDVPKLSVAKPRLSTPQNIVANLVEHFLGLLGSTNDALVFAVGKAVLDLLLTQANQHNDTWIQPVLTAFVGLLRREGMTLNPLPILLAIMGVLPMLNDDLLLATLIRIFPSIKTITDSNQRVSYLIRTFELLIDRHVITSGKSNLFTPLMTDNVLISTFQDDSSSFREEIVVSMVASHHNILSKYLQEENVNSNSNSNSSSNNNSSSLSSSSTSLSTSGSSLSNATALFHLHQIALSISEICLKCVLWAGERLSAHEYCIRFVDWLCRVTLPTTTTTTSSSSSAAASDPTTTATATNAQKLVSLLRSDLLEQIPKIPSDYICLQSIFLLALHLLKSSANKVYEQSDSILLINTLRARFLYLDNQPKFTQFNGSIRNMVMGVSQYGRAVPAQLKSLSAFWLGALECLYLMGLNIPSADSAVQRTLDDLIEGYSSNKEVVSRARFIKKAIANPSVRATPSFAPSNIDFSYCIPIEFLESSNTLRTASDIFAYECKKAITGLAGEHYGSSIRDRPSRDTTLLSGCGDPVWLELLPEKSYQFEVPLSVTGLDHNYVTFSIAYCHPSGMCEIESAQSTKPPPVTMVPIETRLQDYQFDWNQFLIPLKYNKHQFLQQWPRFEASFQVDVVFEGDSVSRELINQCLLNYPFHNVQSSYFDASSFQLAFSSSTWFNDQICFIVTGMDRVTMDEYHGKVIQTRFEFRSSNSGVLSSFQNVLDLWIQKIPRQSDTFLARLQGPGENSLFSITSIKEPTKTTNSTSKPTPSSSTSSIDQEIKLLNQWKEKKTNVQQSNTTTLLSIEQEFY
ncbi:armadillo-like helical domain-containing protein [Heterostelium album PN500]|uniref:Armadillo-like helical domain-containing protein n=1 Tax=Heterostelium pallidum (strain ATCC 26659 / Pp 5 / PN500) TaxID=670386 RepID=D3BNR3_HETP5|nr:armadillo-like helical domain-containing protein [Heterostelium album PN500]EFA76832.1 armadillo-like helical domain-containing protein [Heterostelium album PN500]|eukprot:XP_020428964.1 armadillo-like helical domain-containing protein [Heterostelium album PN500]